MLACEAVASAAIMQLLAGGLVVRHKDKTHSQKLT